MREHALPQDVTGYRFHLIGSMTLKQFAELAAGCIFALIFYASTTPFYVKWPMIALGVGAGAMIAFVPIEERPLDHWVSTFVKIIWRPTQFFWKHESKIPDVFFFNPAESSQEKTVEDIDLTPARRERVKEYLLSIEPPEDVWEPGHLEYFQNITDMFRSSQADVVVGAATNSTNLSEFASSSTGVSDSSVSITTNASGGFTNLADLSAATNVVINPTPSANTGSNQTNIRGGVVQMSGAAGLANPNDVRIQSPSDQVGPADDSLGYVTSETSVANPSPVPDELFASSTSSTQTNRAVYVPANQAVAVKSVVQSGDDFGLAGTSKISDHTFVEGVAQPAIVFDINQVLPAVFNANLPIINPPSLPNMPAGMVLSRQGRPLENVTVEFLTLSGESARAVKTNVLGQFVFGTALNDGDYQIRCSLDNNVFPTFSVKLNGKVITPIEIRSLS